MSDLLTHVLVAYLLFAIVEWRIDGFHPTYISLGMVGAVLPDLSKVRWVIGSFPDGILPVPFSWLAVHRLGAILVIAAIGALLFERGRRRGVFAILTAGAFLHLLMDAMNARADGLTPPYFYPLSWARVPTVDVWVSTEIWPSLLAVVAVGIFWALKRRFNRDTDPS